VHELSNAIKARHPDDLSPIAVLQAPRELRPLVDATNDALARVADLVAHQRRFVRDASHQLRTPLAVLKAQVQSAMRGDLPPIDALQEIGQTIDGATRLANQMLALAKVEQLRQQGDSDSADWATLVHEVALELAALIAERELDFDLTLQPAMIAAHAWALRELTRNLLHNAIKHSPRHGRLTVALQNQGAQAELRIADSGSGIPESLRPRLYQPFSSGEPGSGSGLGLAICRDIVQSLQGALALENRLDSSSPRRVTGLDAIVRLPTIASPPDKHALIPADNPGR
jgi:two-component system sensor histidine kinase TctE